jgi:hypothetical protein
METLTRLVSESLARHGLDRPVDYRRLLWSRWFRCESHHSLLHVPSKPGVFALAEEVAHVGSAHVGTAASAVPPKPALSLSNGQSEAEPATNREGHDFSRADRDPNDVAALAAEGPRRMLAVTQFFEDDDMAFVLDRMLTWKNPMRARLTSGRYFIRYVVLEDETQRRSICAALNQWIANSTEKATGIGAHFATSLELTETNVARPNVARTLLSASACSQDTAEREPKSAPAAPQLHSGANSNIHCPTPLPSGF